MNTVTDIRDLIRERSRELGLVGLWDIIHEVEVKEPQQGYRPALWSWKDIRPLLLEAGRHVSLEESDRRVLILSNPGAPRRHHSTNTLYVSCSIYNGGELATVHRHTANASRFVLEGSGGFTNIEGEKCSMSRGDLIVTPNGTWHDHGNEGSDPVMWIDVLDLPLVEALGSSAFRFDYVEKGAVRKHQGVSQPAEHSSRLYAAGGLKPVFATHRRGDSLGTPMFVYRWQEAKRALEGLRGYEGSPHDGVILEYVNPVDGEPVTTTMSFSVQLLRPGERTRPHRHTASAFYCCLQGRGLTEADGQEFRWGENDLFVLPSWAPHRHVNLDSSGDAILYSVSDAPTLRKLGLYREEAVAAA
jgi:gentisate 1,2-dioxygenase